MDATTRSPAPLIHAPGDDRAWQESMALHWFDPASGAGAVVAFGTFPRWKDGIGLTWVGATLPGAGPVARSANDLSLVEGDRTASCLGAGGGHFSRLGEQHGRLTLLDDRVTAEVEFRDLYPATPWRAGADLGQLAHGHIETSSLVSGELRVDGRLFEFDAALGHRDPSWGPRRLEVCRH